METKEWKTIDKTHWKRGPWNDEPDKVQWQDGKTGLPCLALRHPERGHWCGYVGIAPGHPAYDKGYSSLDDVEVHGGLTFAGYCEEGHESHTLCHVPSPGEPENVYWLGFDCHHGGDRAPGYEAKIRQADLSLLRYCGAGIYRTLEYVKQECAALAEQLQNPELKIT